MAAWDSTVPSLSELIAFEAAHRHRNFTHAAEELHYSQATVSRRIAALEADLGTLLFERGRHHVTPTATADAFAAVVRSALTDLSAAADGIRRRSSDRTRLTVRSDVSLTAAVVNPILGAFQQLHPDIDIRVLSSFEPIESEEEPFDIGLQYARNRQSNFVVEAFADEEVFPVCSPELAERFGGVRSVEDLAQLPLLHVDYGEPAWVGWHGFLQSCGLSPTVELGGPTFSTYVVCLDLAERGQGVALGWGHTARPRIEAGQLVRLDGFTVQLPDALRSYRRPNAEPWDAIDDLLDLVRERMA